MHEMLCVGDGNVMVAMDCVPELTVMKRKTVSSAKMVKRLRRFVRDNQPPEVLPEAEESGDFDDESNQNTRSTELLCRIPEETLFQLQQIYEALEDSGGHGGGGGNSSGSGIGGASRRKSAPGGAFSLKGLIESSADPDDRAGKSETDGVVQTPAKPSKKRARGGDDDAKPEPATDSKAPSRTADATTSPKKKKKKSRRKSNAT